MNKLLILSLECAICKQYPNHLWIIMLKEESLIPLVKAIEENDSFSEKRKEVMVFLVAAEIRNPGSLTSKILRQNVSLNPSHVYNVLNDLEEEGYITRVRQGKYTLINLSISHFYTLLEEHARKNPVTSDTVTMLRQISKTTK